MKPEIKKLWVEALRSGKYCQGMAKMRSNKMGKKQFCVLGVLCDLHRKLNRSSINKWFVNKWGEFFYRGKDCFPPSVVSEWAGMPDGIVKVIYGNGEEEISVLNDKGLSFKKLADLIENHLVEEEN